MAKDYKEINLICKECGKPFTYSVWEQKSFEAKGWKPPVRCIACRQRKKILKKALEDGISISEQGVHEAVCAKCGKKYFSTLEVRKNEKEYCPECWKEIKGF